MPQASKRQSSHASSMEATISVAEAKANFSSLIKTVQKKHGPVTILRRGVPVAQIIPLPNVPTPQLRGSMAGKGQELGDIVSPYLDEWTVSGWPEPESGAEE